MPVNRLRDLPIGPRTRRRSSSVSGSCSSASVPGLVHAFIFWGFLVLFPTIFMALIGTSPRPSLPRSPLGWLAAGLVRLPRRPLRRARARRRWVGILDPQGAAPARFEGSHLGEADLILGLIAGIVSTLLLWHATLIALGLNAWPAAGRRSRMRSPGSSATTRRPRCSSGSSSGPTC